MLKRFILVLALTSLLSFINASANAKQIKYRLIIIIANNNFANVNSEKKEQRANFLFREMMKDFPHCKIKGAYLAEWENINQPKNIFFQENNLSPYKIENGFAYYKLNINYYNLPVIEMLIPADTWGVFGVTFGVPLPKAREVLKSLFDSDFLENELSELGQVPYLISDPQNADNSIWICDDPT